MLLLWPHRGKASLRAPGRGEGFGEAPAGSALAVPRPSIGLAFASSWFATRTVVVIAMACCSAPMPLTGWWSPYVPRKPWMLFRELDPFDD